MINANLFLSGVKIGLGPTLEGQVVEALIDWGISRNDIAPIQVSRDNLNAYNASQAAYGSKEHHQRIINAGYVRNEELSTEHASVYHAGINGSIIAYRGTQLDAEDILADFDIGRGVYTNDAFIRAESLFNTVRNTYGDNVLLTGHSLGGTKAVRAAEKYGGKAIVFNPGSPAPGAKPLETGKHEVYHKTEDVISTNISGENIHRTSGGHSLNEFEKDFY